MKIDTAIPPRYRRIYKGKQHHTPPFTFQRRNGGCIYKNKKSRYPHFILRVIGSASVRPAL